MKKQGATLIELLIVIASIGILAVILAPALRQAYAAGNERQQCANNLKQYGLSLKMYAMESRGERFPPIHFEIIKPERRNPNFPDPLPEHQYITNFSPRIFSMYPEYISDLRITICPADTMNRLALIEDTTCVLYDDTWDENSKNEHIIQGCSDTMDDSYTYLSWVFDKDGNDGDPTHYDTRILEKAWKPFGLSFDYRKPEDAAEDSIWFSTQSTATFTKALVTAGPLIEDALSNTNDGHKRFLDAWDWDHTLDQTVIEDFDPDVKYGIGNSNTVFRLREGIERFLITDINNPGASAQAQSNVFIMYDNNSTYAAGFSHIPGGSNVLYLDGHVEFVRLGAKPPVMSGNAHLAGAFHSLGI